MHHTVRSGYTLSEGTLQTSGALERVMTDEVHANHPGNAQIAEAVAAAIINLI
jgi:lysophospholipase L1-like esterase